MHPDDEKLMKKDLVLTYRTNRIDKKEPQVDLEGLWLPRDVQKMSAIVMRKARAHKAGLIRERELSKVEEPKTKKQIKKETKDGGRKQKRK